jgi:hypothetical protein
MPHSSFLLDMSKMYNLHLLFKSCQHCNKVSMMQFKLQIHVVSVLWQRVFCGHEIMNVECIFFLVLRLMK